MTRGDLSSGRRCAPGPDRLRVLRGHPEHRSGPGRIDGERSGGTRPGTGPTADSSPVTSPLPDAPYGAADLNPPGSAAPPRSRESATTCRRGSGNRHARRHPGTTRQPVSADVLGREPIPYPYAVLAVIMALLGLAMTDQTWGLLAVLAGALAYRRGRRT